MQTPPPEPASSVLFQRKWKAELRASGAMTPRVPVQFVAEQGRAIRARA
ncbi:hypothetical protein HI113_20015 [Corallococcus exiguus]|nr:hypothetical protein [Corallococcus exiguus]NNB96186.1 hypothetical protein [Corallococcus exiguus]